MYCVKCKKRTDTTNERITTTKNNRHMKRGTCVICGTTCYVHTQFYLALYMCVFIFGFPCGYF